jgi:hypothetical protein
MKQSNQCRKLIKSKQEKANKANQPAAPKPIGLNAFHIGDDPHGSGRAGKEKAVLASFASGKAVQAPDPLLLTSLN